MLKIRLNPDALRVGLAAGCLLVTTSGPVRADVVAASAWIAEPPPVDVPVAGYVTLRNEGRNEVTITAITSSQFQRVETHETFLVDGVAQMRAAGAQVIPAGATLQMRPGGRHLMLFGPAQLPQAGETVTLRFEFDAAPPLEVRAEVRGTGREGPIHRHGVHDHRTRAQAAPDSGSHDHRSHDHAAHDHAAHDHAPHDPDR